MLDLHGFMVAISRIEVNHDGLVALLQMPWFGMKVVSSRLVPHPFILIIDRATLPGPPDFLSGTWCTLDSLPITQG